jgi:hypothetical protein
MAFNPLNRFRRHQKAIFAGLTIVCMFTFVLTSGVGSGGDFLSEVARMFGVRSTANEAARLFGKRVEMPEILRLREQRRLANQFMSASLDVALNSALGDLQKSVPDLANQIKSQLQSVLFARQLIGQGGFGRQYYQQQLFGLLNQLEGIIERLRAEKKTGDADKIVQLRDLLQKDLVLAQQHDDLYEGAPLYFGGSTSEEGILDFMIWKRQADELGIYLSMEDVGREYNRETLGLLTREQQSSIQQFVFRSGRANTPGLLAALGDEFRVRLAQAALVGYDPNGIIKTPAPVPPYELWQYYVRERTEVSVDVLPVAVEPFMADVKAPTQQELESFFEQYKDQEYAPDKETPGFKLPQRVAIEWIEASKDAPRYRKAAESSVLGLIAEIPADPLAAIAFFYGLDQDYQRLRSGENFDSANWNYYRLPARTEGDFRLAFYTYKALHRPEVLASFLGRLVGDVAQSTCGLAKEVSTLQAALSLEGTATLKEAAPLREVIAQEANGSVPLAMSLFGTGTAGQPCLSAAAILDDAAHLTQYLPFAVVQGDMIQKMEGSLAESLVAASLDTFKRDLDALKKDQPEFIKKEIQKYDWKHGSTTGLEDNYRIAEDPGLKPLEEAYLSNDRSNDFHEKQRFASIFFQQRRDQKPKLYKPEELPPRDPRGPQKFVFWRTAEKPPQVPTFKEVQKQVAEAWRLEQARTLARGRADKIAEQCREAKGDAIRNMTDAGKQLHIQPFRLDAVARLKASPMARAGFGSQYEPYKVPEDKIRYPRSDFVDKILDDLTQKGDVIVLTDQPVRHYYVVALSQRDPPSMKEFRQAALLERLAQEQRRKYREQVRDSLRQQAGFWINEENRKDLDDRRSDSTF